MFCKLLASVFIVLLFAIFLENLIGDTPDDITKSVNGLLMDLPNLPDDLGDDDDAQDETVHIVFVVCGRGHRLEEAEMLVKSAVLHTQTDLRFTVVTDQQKLLEPRLRAIIDKIEMFEITADFHPPGLVKEKDADIVNTWGPCQGLRNFFPSLLPNIRKIIYVDTDVLFQDSPHNLWTHFQHMNRSQIMAIAANQAQKSLSSYDNDVRFPHPPGGLNTGVMLLNLERMRRIGYKEIILKVIKHFKNHFAIPDQDPKVILSGLFPKLLYRLPVSWNTNFLMCSGCLEEQPLCKVNKLVGSKNVSLIHGTFHTFHQPISITSREGIKMVVEKLYRGIKTYQNNLTTVHNAFFPYYISSTLGWEKVTIMQQIFQTYKAIDMSNVCQTLDQQITDNWETKSYDGYWCEQYVPDIVYSLNQLHNRHCNVQLLKSV